MLKVENQNKQKIKTLLTLQHMRDNFGTIKFYFSLKNIFRAERHVNNFFI